MFMCKVIKSSIRNNIFLIVGIIVGVSLSLFFVEIIESNCYFDSPVTSTSNSEHASLILTDEYEPRINLAGKPMKAQKTPQEFVRPRYFSTELGIREKLFVAVLTNASSYENYGIALNKTLAHVVNKIIFFSENDNKPLGHDVSGLVRFSDSRLILKPFHMLKYIADNFLEEYDFFYLIKDTSYVHGRALIKLVRSLSISKNVHMGGGKMDQLTTFCSLNSGILLSSSLMRMVTTSLDWCVRNAFSDVDDANLGRCILHATDVPCQASQQDVNYVSHQLLSPDQTLSRVFADMALNDAVSVWPLSRPQDMYRLHLHFSELDLHRVDSEISSLRRAISDTIVILPNNRTDETTWPVGSAPTLKPMNRFDLIRWDYFTEDKIYLKSDFSNVENLHGADLLDVKNILNASIQHLENKYEGQIAFKRLINGYRKFDPSRGMDYILDLAVKDVVTGRQSYRRMEACKPLGKVELVPVPYVTENTRVNVVIIATAENKESLLKFIHSYATVCMEKRDKTSLLMLLVYESDQPGKGAKNDIHSELKAEAVKQSERFRRDNNKITWLSVKLPRTKVPSGILDILILDLIVKKFSPENLMLICTPNMDFRQDYLNRVRMNTVLGNQVFSPIPFTEYNPLIVYNDDFPRPKELDINKNYGHYDDQNMDHIAFYVRDYKAARKNIDNDLPIAHTDRDLASTWRSNATFLTGASSIYKLFVRLSPLHVFRAVEPSLRLRYTERPCGRDFSEECWERMAHNLGTRSQLGKLILDYHKQTVK